MESKYKKAAVKYNSGMGARLCNNCGYILSYGFDHTDTEAFCGDCYNELWDALFTIANLPPNKDSVLQMKKVAKDAYRKVLRRGEGTEDDSET